MAQGKTSVTTLARTWYLRLEQPISSISLIGGFVFDAFTLRRVNLAWDSFWVIAHLAVVTVSMVWVNLLDTSAPSVKPPKLADPSQLQFWLVNVMQFFFGGLLSAYLVVYFRSSTIITSWPFLLILAVALVANQTLKRRLTRLSFQIALLFLTFYAFAIYLMPMLLGRIGAEVFLISGVVSVAAIVLVLTILAAFSPERFQGRARWAVLGSVAGILAVMNFLYFLGLIPPLPLSLKQAGVYHSLAVRGPGQYTVTTESSRTRRLTSMSFLKRFFSLSQRVYLKAGDSLVVYTAVYCPTRLHAKIIHEWQYYDPTRQAWITRARVSLSVVGGGPTGYRTFSEVTVTTPGPWRVDVETPRGQVIGRVNFDVIFQNRQPPLTTKNIG